MIDMTPSLVLVVLIAVLVGAGVYLVLERTLTRVIIGTALITHGVNLLILMEGGRAGGPPLIGATPPEDMSDPLPQAFVLTAIVISLAITAFALAMAYRSWQLNGHDEVQDDLEDRRIARMAAIDALIDRATDDSGDSVEESAETIRDEIEQSPELADEILADLPQNKGATLAPEVGPQLPDADDLSGDEGVAFPDEDAELDDVDIDEDGVPDTDDTRVIDRLTDDESPEEGGAR